MVSILNSSSLFLKVPESKVSSTPLFIGTDAVPSGSVDLFTYSDKYARPKGSGSAMDSDADLFLSGQNLLGSGSIPLFVSSTESSLPVSGYCDLYIESDPFVQGQVGIADSGAVSLFIDSNNDNSVFFGSNQSVNIYLKNEDSSPTKNNNAPLYIEKVTDSQVPLYITSTISSENIPLFTSGVFMDNSNVDLFIKPLENYSIILFVQGYIE